MKIVAIKECSAGNESVGTEWLETCIFDEDATVKDVLKWASSGRNYLSTKGNRIMLTIADDWDQTE